MGDSKKHSLLAPSAASRWMACPPSAMLSQKFDDDTESVYAAEGTLAHRLAELYLLDFIKGRAWREEHPDENYRPAEHNPEALEALEAEKKNPLFYPGMFREVADYTEHVVRLFDDAGPGATLAVETPVPLFYRPEDTGTIDSLVYGGQNRTLYVTDLKFGKGVKVDAPENKQLLIYAISALDYLESQGLAGNTMVVVLTIVQPRLHYVSKWELTLAELDARRAEIEQAAHLAAEGAGEFAAGDHCRFCPVKPRCRALRELAAEVAAKQFDDPALLTEGEVAGLLGTLDTVSDWIAAVKKHALAEALNGTCYEGYKLVAGASRRKVADEPGLLRALTAAGYDDVLLRRWSLAPLSDLQVLVTPEDFKAICAPFITRTEAAPTLVAASDPRPAYGVTKAAENFAEFNN